jgi:hypothetical protein
MSAAAGRPGRRSGRPGTFVIPTEEQLGIHYAKLDAQRKLGRDYRAIIGEDELWKLSTEVPAEIAGVGPRDRVAGRRENAADFDRENIGILRGLIPYNSLLTKDAGGLMSIHRDRFYDAVIVPIVQSIYVSKNVDGSYTLNDAGTIKFSATKDVKRDPPGGNIIKEFINFTLEGNDRFILNGHRVINLHVSHFSNPIMRTTHDGVFHLTCEFIPPPPAVPDPAVAGGAPAPAPEPVKGRVRFIPYIREEGCGILFNWKISTPSAADALLSLIAELITTRFDAYATEFLYKVPGRYGCVFPGTGNNAALTEYRRLRGDESIDAGISADILTSIIDIRAKFNNFILRIRGTLSSLSTSLPGSSKLLRGIKMDIIHILTRMLTLGTIPLASLSEERSPHTNYATLSNYSRIDTLLDDYVRIIDGFDAIVEKIISIREVNIVSPNPDEVWFIEFNETYKRILIGRNIRVTDPSDAAGNPLEANGINSILDLPTQEEVLNIAESFIEADAVALQAKDRAAAASRRSRTPTRSSGSVYVTPGPGGSGGAAAAASPNATIGSKTFMTRQVSGKVGGREFSRTEFSPNGGKTWVTRNGITDAGEIKGTPKGTPKGKKKGGARKTRRSNRINRKTRRSNHSNRKTRRNNRRTNRHLRK